MDVAWRWTHAPQPVDRVVCQAVVVEMFVGLIERAPHRDRTGEACLCGRVGLGKAGAGPRVADIGRSIIKPVGVVVVVALEPMRVPAPVVPAGGVVEILWVVWVKTTSSTPPKKSPQKIATAEKRSHVPVLCTGYEKKRRKKKHPRKWRRHLSTPLP